MLGHFYSGNISHCDEFVHIEDVVNAIENTVESRQVIPDQMASNIGEPTSPTYQELQDSIGNLIHGKDLGKSLSATCYNNARG
ncbi:hypothetical protein D9V96_014055 [Zobellia laminariae]|uniref:hypothetical protein n=1 Tax=Zobellia laminariae TaxID=248906 RepID=UPI0012D8D9C4|nr:hypothetical protein [Zobellia laminariae]